MRIDVNDPRLTAYVLGELDEKSRRAVEEQVNRSKELSHAVAEITQVVAALKTVSVQTAPEALTTPQRAAIEHQSRERKRPVHAFARDQGSDRLAVSRLRYWVPLTLAASIVLVAGTYYFDLLPMHLAHSRESAEQVVALDTSRNARRGGERFGEVRSLVPDRNAQVIVTTRRERSIVNSAGEELSERKTRRKDQGYVGAYEWADRRVAGNLAAQNSAQPGDLYFFGGGLDTLSDAEITNLSYACQSPFGPNGFVEDGKLHFGIASETYAPIFENTFINPAAQPLSTFSIDVDTASYANVRRMLNSGLLPPPGAVRIEEMINYFDYDYAGPTTGTQPFAVHVEVSECPWSPDHRLARIGIKGREFQPGRRPSANLVFLIDVSGSMQTPVKLPLVTQSLRLLVDQLRRDDRVAMVVYAGASGLVLDSTAGNQKPAILAALDSLRAGGSTNGGAGIQLAYDTAVANYIDAGINRVILATDGDFNVGITDQGQLTQLVTERAKEGVFLSVLGYGMGNLKDSTLESLADKGNGNYAYIDTLNEAQKVLVEQMEGTLVTIAKDVKIQVEFNPLQVGAYRLIGYENRLLAARDFNDDTKDAGEIGAGHTVTALYEIVPVGLEANPNVDPLKYQTVTEPSAAATSGELMTVKLRYKHPDGDTSELIEMSVVDEGGVLEDATDDLVFAAAVASFGTLLRGSVHAENLSFDYVAELAASGMGQDVNGYRTEFIELVRKAAAIKAPSDPNR